MAENLELRDRTSLPAVLFQAIHQIRKALPAGIEADHRLAGCLKFPRQCNQAVILQGDN
jgi:hypothetical protein